MSAILSALSIHILKNYVKGQGRRRRPFICGSSSGTKSSQSSSQPSGHMPADCVRAICRDRELLLILGGHLGAMDSKKLARAVATATASRKDGNQDFIY